MFKAFLKSKSNSYEGIGIGGNSLSEGSLLGPFSLHNFLLSSQLTKERFIIPLNLLAFSSNSFENS